MTRHVCRIVVVLFSGMVGVTAQAAVITDEPVMVWENGSMTPCPTIVQQPMENFGNIVGDPPNIVILLDPVRHHGMQPVDYVFSGANSPAIMADYTDYALSGLTINESGIDWTGMIIQLGYGHGEDFVALDTIGAPLDFDTPEKDGAVRFQDFDLIRYEDALLEWGNSVAISSSMFHNAWDIPIHVGNHGNTPFNFTIRHTPIPEPQSLVLLAAGSVLLGLKRRA